MDRRDFAKILALLGVYPLTGSSCSSLKSTGVLKPTDSVVIIGAGAAGLSAAHLLNQAGTEVLILEANSGPGGRMRRTLEFADFPIPTGAEWLHTERSIFTEILNNSQIQPDLVTRPYNYERDYALIAGEKMDLRAMGFSIDQKFIGSTWYDFFQEYIIPGIEDKILYNKKVKVVDYSADEVLIETDHEEFRATELLSQYL